MKWIFGAIKLVLVFGFMALAFLLLINKTFINEVYLEDFMIGEGIPIKRFMYFQNINSDLTANFITPLNYETLNNAKNSYLESLEKCYDRYYYDSNNAITIIDYDISNDKYLRSVSIHMANDNYCSEDYKLSDMWIYDYENLSLYVNGDITQNAMSRVISTIHEAERVNNPTIVDDYEAEVILKINASTESIGYTLTFQDFSENELLVIKQMNNKTQFAVYTLENVIDFLNSLERRVNS